MTLASAHASKFYEEAARNEMVYTFTAEENDFLVFKVRDNEVVPFWSSTSRMLRIQKAHPKYVGFTILPVPLVDFLQKTLPYFESEQIHVGVNWSGARLTGYDVSAADLARNIESLVQERRRP